jgi:hypothetical protein
MSTTCAVCERGDWLDVGICTACAGTAGLEFVFIAPRARQRDPAEAERQLRDIVGSPLDQHSVSEVSRGRQPLALLPRTFAHRAARRLESAGLAARVLPRSALHRALPLGFAVMLLAIVIVGVIGGMRGVPVLLTASPLVAATLLFSAHWHLRTPLLATPPSSALLPEPARVSLADALAQLDDARTCELLRDIARMGEATFTALPEAFRTAALGESVIELLREAGPLAREAAHLREIATELGVRDGARNEAEAQQIDDAANARFALLEDVLALLGRLAREGARSDAEVARLLQLVREESARRIEAESVVATLLNTASPA